MASQRSAEPPLFYLDASAFLNGADRPPARCRTTAAILAEFRPGGRSYDRVQRFLAAGMEIQEPTKVETKRAEATARAAGSLGRLSRADLDLVSAALSRADVACVVSDDYTVQDLARRLQLRFQSVHTTGITESREWVARCLGCRRTYAAAQAARPCPVCGSELRLKTKPAPGAPRDSAAP